ncbi:MAG: hypothetical protein JNK04_18550 [Myxococcales bacterium]|nr:hypothetical protein [Myxococcales bacterium]
MHRPIFLTLLLVSCNDVSTMPDEEVSTFGAALSIGGILGPGSVSQFVSSTTSNNYKNVDEQPCNGNVDYNVVQKGVGAVDTYQVDISGIPNGALITEVRITPCASRDVTLASKGPSFEAFYSWDGVQGRVSAPWKLPYQTTPVPVGLPQWSLPAHHIKDASTKLEVGVRVLTNHLNQGIRLSQVAVTVHYTVGSSDSGGFGPGDPSPCDWNAVCEPTESCGCGDCDQLC